MSEMLASQYFISRKYEMAVGELERVLAVNPQSKSVKKKLIICYIKTSMIKEAFQTFSELVKQDIFFIINTDIVADYCPCPQIIYEYENAIDLRDEYIQELILGMLWLYCDIDKAIKIFNKIRKYAKYNSDIESIISTLNSVNHELKSENEHE